MGTFNMDINQTTLNSSERNTSNGNLVCSEDFFFDENRTGLCRPECGKFQQQSLAVQIIETLAICVGAISSIVLVVLTLTLHRDTM